MHHDDSHFQKEEEKEQRILFPNLINNPMYTGDVNVNPLIVIWYEQHNVTTSDVYATPVPRALVRKNCPHNRAIRSTIMGQFYHHTWSSYIEWSQWGVITVCTNKPLLWDEIITIVIMPVQAMLVLEL